MVDGVGLLPVAVGEEGDHAEHAAEQVVGPARGEEGAVAAVVLEDEEADEEEGRPARQQQGARPPGAARRRVRHQAPRAARRAARCSASWSSAGPQLGLLVRREQRAPGLVVGRSARHGGRVCRALRAPAVRIPSGIRPAAAADRTRGRLPGLAWGDAAGAARPSLVTMYVLSLAATIAFLVVWVVYLVRSGSGSPRRGRAGGPAAGVNWLLLIVGCVLLFFVIVGLTYQLAQALAARRYALKQEEFLSNITHEMKSPLAAIKLHAQTLQQPEDLAPDTRRRFAATIEQQADRMAALVDSVLESSRLLARRRKLELHPVDLSAFLAGYLESATAQARRRGVTPAPRGRRRRAGARQRGGPAPRARQPDRQRGALLAPRRRGALPGLRPGPRACASRSRTTASAFPRATCSASSTASTRPAARASRTAAAPASASRSSPAWCARCAARCAPTPRRGGRGRCWWSTCRTPEDGA